MKEDKGNGGMPWPGVVVIAIWSVTTIGITVTSIFTGKALIGYGGPTFITFCFGIGYLIIRFKEKIKIVVKGLKDNL